MASGVSSTQKKKSFSKTTFLSSDPDPNDFCARLKLLLQEKQAGNNSNIFNDEIIAIVENLLEYKCISKKQQKQLKLSVIYYTSKYN